MSFSLNKFLFGPLDVEYCNYFYILSVLAYAMFLFISGSLVVTFVTNNRKVDAKFVTTMIGGALLYGAYYLQSRLLHSMCVKKEGYQSRKLNTDYTV